MRAREAHAAPSRHSRQDGGTPPGLCRRTSIAPPTVQCTTQQLHMLLQPRVTATKALRPSGVARTGKMSAYVSATESCTLDIWAEPRRPVLGDVLPIDLPCLEGDDVGLDALADRGVLRVLEELQ